MAAHSHVGDGHVAVVGIVLWKREGVSENARLDTGYRGERVQREDIRERRASVKDIVVCKGTRRGDSEQLTLMIRNGFRTMTLDLLGVKSEMSDLILAHEQQSAKTMSRTLLISLSIQYDTHGTEPA